MIKLVIGLGNIGKAYEKTVHNMGFIVLDGVAEKTDTKFKTKECDAETAFIYMNGEKVVLARPTTYMNNSGVAVKELMRKYKVECNDILVIVDDIDLAPGTIRLREKGSAGTHNGLKSIIAEIGTGDFKRVRVGVGRPPEFMDLADFVLSNAKMTSEQKQGIDKAINCVYDLVMGETFDKASQKYNQK